MTSRKYSGKGKNLKKQNAPEKSEKLWKNVYVILCLVLLVVTALQIFLIYFVPTSHWDYRTYVSAIQAFDAGQNPYILSNLVPYQSFGTELVFDYPPHTLYLFWLLDFFSIFHNIYIYSGLLFALLLLGAYLILHLDKKPHYLFLTTLLLTGFMSAFWNFQTGNIPILFLLLFAITFTLLIQEKYWLSSIVMGLSAAVSLLTAPFVVLYLTVRRPVMERVALISTSIGVVASLFVVSYLINPTYMLSYISMMFGSKSPFLESGGWNQPTPYLMFKDALKDLFPGNMIPVVVVSCTYIGLILYATWKYYQKNDGNSKKILSLVMLSVFMLLPRLMPYNFIILVVPLYLLFKDYSYRVKTLMFVIISLPIFVWILFATNPFVWGYYVQAYSLILIFLLVILLDHLAPVSDTKENTGDTSRDVVR
ncbi:MAG: DUF2029 domain-containing protein [Methanoregula sp.]|nr:DUF2029 domain-containing protein [Methanoregula sp.]